MLKMVSNAYSPVVIVTDMNLNYYVLSVALDVAEASNGEKSFHPLVNVKVSALAQTVISYYYYYDRTVVSSYKSCTCWHKSQVDNRVDEFAKHRIFTDLYS